MTRPDWDTPSIAGRTDVVRDLRSQRALQALRSEIADSWRRSAEAGLAPDRLGVPEVEADTDGPFLRSAMPVLRQLHTDLALLDVSVVLTDPCAGVLFRVDTSRAAAATVDAISLAPGYAYTENAVGTNAIGTALTTGSGVQVLAREHFSEMLVDVSCAAAPVVNPTSGLTVGVLDITCRAVDASPMMLGLVKSAARELGTLLTRDVAPLKGLTPAEQRVAALVAGGLSNRAIAKELFVSPYTVDAHLRAIYRKFDVHSRAALARRVADV